MLLLHPRGNVFEYSIRPLKGAPSLAKTEAECQGKQVLSLFGGPLSLPSSSLEAPPSDRPRRCLQKKKRRKTKAEVQ